MRFLLLTLALTIVVPATAFARPDRTACLANPTADCAFRLALDIAAGEARDSTFRQESMKVAARLGRPDAMPPDEAIALIRRGWDLRAPDEPDSWAGAMCWVERDYTTEAYLEAALAALRTVDTPAALKARMHCLYLLERWAEALDLNRRIIANGGDLHEGIHRHLYDGGPPEMIADLVAQVTDDEGKRRLEISRFLHRLRTMPLSEAVSVVGADTDEDVLYRALSASRRAVSTDADRAALHLLAERIAAEEDGYLHPDVVAILAMRGARAGEWDRTMEYLARLAPGAGRRETTEILATLVGARGEWDTVRSLLETELGASTSAARSIVTFAVRSARQAGRDDFDDLLASLPRNLRDAAEMELLRYRIEFGDAGDRYETVQMLLRRLSLNAKDSSARALLQHAARWAVQDGEIVMGMGVALAFKDPSLMAEIAASLPPRP